MNKNDFSGFFGDSCGVNKNFCTDYHKTPRIIGGIDTVQNTGETQHRCDD